MSKFSCTFIGIFSLIVSFFSFINIIYSNYFNHFLNLQSYFYSLIPSLLLALTLLLIKKSNRKVSVYEKIIIITFGYLFLPLLISAPYYFSIYDISFTNSYFEAISGFTSTGFSIFENIKQVDESLILWRSSSQWIGGLYFLFSIILLIEIFDSNFKKTFTDFFLFSNSELLRQLFKILILYFSLTLLIFFILKFSGFRYFDAVNLSFTIIASGGFLPTNSLDSILNNNLKEIVLSSSMLLSFFSLFLIYNLIFLKNKKINFYQEDIYLLIYLISVIIFFTLFTNFNKNFTELFLSVASSVSNIGISKNTINNNNSFLFLILVVIGGSLFSSSSGLRFLKIYTLFKYSINELISHVKPKEINTIKLKFSDYFYDNNEINKIFVTLIFFILSIFALGSILTLFGIEFVYSFKLSILTLMNTATSTIYGLEDFNFYDLSIITKYFLIFFMILGRIELLTLLIVLKKIFFKN
tara:strand:- start:1263 stop:2669 length:1407 start_codon:yes stop_codon:yes gene_type:complete